MLALDSRNVKALFRQAKALYQLSEFSDAKKRVFELLKVESGNSEARHLLEEIKKKEEIVNKQQKQIFSNIFNGNDQLYSNEEIAALQQPKTKKCSICGEEVDAIQLARHVIKKHGNVNKT